MCLDKERIETMRDREEALATRYEEKHLDKEFDFDAGWHRGRALAFQDILLMLKNEEREDDSVGK